MKPDFGTIISGIGFVSLLASGFIILKSSVFRETANGWQSLAMQRAEEVKDLRAANAALEARVSHLEQVVKDQQAHIRDLLDMVEAKRRSDRQQEAM